MSNKSNNWFSVDRDGLRDLHSAFPLERMVCELVANAWDEGVSRCDVLLEREFVHGGKAASRMTVLDNSPEGFRDLRDAFTLFRTTKKRSDPTVRGRFNFGEKIVISRSLFARIISTKGEIVFDKGGRHESKNKTDSGTRVEVVFMRWEAAEYAQALEFLKKIIPPAATATWVNGEHLVGRKADAGSEATLPTELLVSEGGVPRVTKTKRKTRIDYYRVAARKAMLLEMGMPVCDIPGVYDMDVQQKVPVSSDRTTVAVSYLQDLMAEAILALGDKVKAEEVGMSVIQLALEDDRVSPTAAKEVFHGVFGDKALIQSHRPDEDQEAARQGYTLVSPRALGGSVNSKLRDAGVKTTHQMFSRGVDSTDPMKPVPASEQTSAMAAFSGYARMLATELYGTDESFSVEFGRWEKGSTIALNSNRTRLIFHPERIDVNHPVSKGTAVILHELAHCKGSGHDGVYDHEFERLVDRVAVLMLQRPQLFRQFEAL